GSTAMRKVVGRIPLARDETRSLSRSAPYSTWTCVSRAGAARSFTELGGAAGPWLGRLGRRTCASGGSLLSTRCREGGALRVFGVRRVRAVGELASPARLDEWATRLLGHLLVADVLGRLLAGRRALHKLLAEFLREVIVRGAADELLRLLPLARGPVLFAEVVPKRFLVGHVGPLGGDPDARAQGGLLRPPGLRLRRGLAGCGLLGVALGGGGGGLLAHLLGGGLALLGHESFREGYALMLTPRRSESGVQQLAVAFWRCMNIPPRYCTGYLGDIGVPPPSGPMDFAA